MTDRIQFNQRKILELQSLIVEVGDDEILAPQLKEMLNEACQELEVETSKAYLQDILNNFQEVVSPLLMGKPFLYGRTSYGLEMNLHFGVEQDHDHPKMQNKKRGSHVLSLRGSAWLIQSGTKPQFIEDGILLEEWKPEGDPISAISLELGEFLDPSADRKSVV